MEDDICRIETDEDIVASDEGENVFIESAFAYNTLPQAIISPELQLHFMLPTREKPLVPLDSVTGSQTKAIRKVLVFEQLPCNKFFAERTWCSLLQNSSFAIDRLELLSCSNVGFEAININYTIYDYTHIVTCGHLL
ncbi:PREDICTED: uncharacterized protein LOC105954902 [Erythranthe guttata]|uniref:uncharacterized protein LOC105954902 n=1 Tax=Erythranthe guttata TaxID=4155 RepID=UPI00064DD021|nr:PREDICTED: uncharacterized protein LOC105954902 [Erythranthe guttata]|eukprot:XP_012834039.1 PREDICTED: uncharacterized protein LOC105954902 [Erythranthe guttata]